METHPELGERIIAPIDRLQEVRAIVRHCHERWDGAAIRTRIAAEEIPLESRIIFVCDAYHAMTTDRPYRKRLSHRRRSGGCARRGHAVRPACRRGRGARAEGRLARGPRSHGEGLPSGDAERDGDADGERRGGDAERDREALLGRRAGADSVK